MIPTFEDFKGINLQDLRAYAREIGVDRPTAHNKTKLIQLIIDVERGVIAPKITKRGRPTNRVIKPIIEGKCVIKSEVVNEINSIIKTLEKLLDKVSKM